jgi:hypothetical protein
MTRRLLRVTLLGLIGLVALGALLNSVAPGWISVSVSPLASATSTRADSGGAGLPVSNKQCELAGVTLVVEYPARNIPLVRCVSGFQGTGWQLFEAARVAVAGTDQYPQGFVCRIAGYPTVAQQPCHSTPTIREGNWTYWFASAETGGKWHLAMQGAAARKPLCGNVEAWVFTTGEVRTEPAFSAKPLSCVID